MEDHINKSPFKFLDSYSEADKDIFFGRENETEELYAKVSQSKLLLVYGASGTGKSSVINCGLANKFDDSDWLPIHIRRGGHIVRSMYNQISKETVLNVELPEETDRTNENLKTLIGSVFLDHFKPIYLIFDQFEELFIFGFEDEWKQFITTIKFLIETDLDVHFIFVLRGEYLEFLSEFEQYIPDFFDNRVRIEKMTRMNALKSISEPAKLYSIDLEENFEENLIKKISPDKAQVELTFLQVFLDKIYKKALDQYKNGGRVSFKNDQIETIGQIGDVLAEFVDEQLFRMDDTKAALTVLKAFVSLQGTKTQMTADEVYQYTTDIGYPIDPSKIEKILIELINKRILKEKDENNKYELRHDSLAQKIYEKITHQEREILDVRQFLSHSYNEYEKRGILLNDDDLTYIAPYERQLKLRNEIMAFIQVCKKKSDKRKKANRRKSIIAVVIILLMISSVIGFIYSQQQKSRAETLANIAANESAESRKQKAIAEEQSELAKSNELKAKDQAEIAISEREKALSAKKEAENQRREALVQKQIAEREKILADEARIHSELSEKQALESKKVAEKERQKAFTLRILGLAREVAIKSTHMVDPQIKSLIAVQAYKFNKRYNGDDFQPDIYAALYESKKSLELNQNEILIAHNQPVIALVNYKDIMYSAGSDGKVAKITFNEGKAQFQLIFESDLAIKTFAISADGKHAIIGTLFGEIILMNLVNEGKIFEIKPSSTEIITTGFTEQNLVAFDTEGQIILFDKTGTVTQTIKTDVVPTAATITSSGLWVGTKSGALMNFDFSGIKISTTKPIKNKTITSIASNVLQTNLAIGFSQGGILIFDTKNLNAIQLLPGHSAAITQLVFDETSSLLISGSYDRSVRLWQLTDAGSTPIIIQDRNQWISSIALDTDNDRFYTGEFDGVVRSFDLSQERMQAQICSSISQNMSTDEWIKYVGSDIPYEKTCGND